MSVILFSIHSSAFLVPRCSSRIKNDSSSSSRKPSKINCRTAKEQRKREKKRGKKENENDKI